MPILFDAIHAVGRALEAIHENIAEGGTTTTIVDTDLVNLGWGTDDFKGGTALIIRDAAGAGAAPEKQSRQVTAYAAGSGTITTDAFTVAPASGDWYGVMTNRYPRGLIVSKVNQTLAEFGDIPTEDISSLTTASGTREYNLPIAAKKDLRQVWLARNTAAPWNWEPVMTAYVEGANANTVGNLIFPYQPRAPYKLKLVYMAAHPLVTADADYISEYVSLDWLALDAAAKCVRARLESPGANEKRAVSLLNDLLQQAERARNRRPRFAPQPFPSLGTFAIGESIISNGSYRNR